MENLQKNEFTLIEYWKSCEKLIRACQKNRLKVDFQEETFLMCFCTSDDEKPSGLKTEEKPL